MGGGGAVVDDDNVQAAVPYPVVVVVVPYLLWSFGGAGENVLLLSKSLPSKASCSDSEG